MKIITSTHLKNGKLRTVVETDPDETIMAVRQGCQYRLGDPMGDVLPAHIIESMVPVMWCPIEQRWVE